MRCMPFTVIQQVHPNSFLLCDIIQLGLSEWFCRENDADTEKKMIDYLFKRVGMAKHINQKYDEFFVSALLKKWAENLSLVKLAISHGIDPCRFMKISYRSDVEFYVLQACIFSGNHAGK